MEIKRQEFVCNKFLEDNNTMCKHNLFKVYMDKIGWYLECQKCKRESRIKIRFTPPTMDIDVQGGKTEYINE